MDYWPYRLNGSKLRNYIHFVIPEEPPEIRLYNLHRKTLGEWFYRQSKISIKLCNQADYQFSYHFPEFYRFRFQAIIGHARSQSHNNNLVKSGFGHENIWATPLLVWLSRIMTIITFALSIRNRSSGNFNIISNQLSFVRQSWRKVPTTNISLSVHLSKWPDNRFFHFAAHNRF